MTSSQMWAEHKRKWRNQVANSVTRIRFESNDEQLAFASFTFIAWKSKFRSAYDS